MEIEFDQHKAISNFNKHAVTFDDAQKRQITMRDEYDFSSAKRANEVPHLAKLQAESESGKSRITIFLDDDVLAEFKKRAS